jgi:hypothetical protein
MTSHILMWTDTLTDDWGGYPQNSHNVCSHNFWYINSLQKVITYITFNIGTPLLIDWWFIQPRLVSHIIGFQPGSRMPWSQQKWRVLGVPTEHSTLTSFKIHVPWITRIYGNSNTPKLVLNLSSRIRQFYLCGGRYVVAILKPEVTRNNMK